MGSAYVRGYRGQGGNVGVRKCYSHVETLHGLRCLKAGIMPGWLMGVRELLTELSYPFEMAVKAGRYH